MTTGEPPPARRRRRRRAGDGGFTLIEVLIALLIAMVGLMGTLAVQQTVLGATANTNDAQVALRLATRAMEELRARRTEVGPPILDQLAPLATGNWTTAVFLDTDGRVSATRTAAARFSLQRLVINTGTGLPYNVSVAVAYALDNGAPRAVRLDAERRKSW